jgi:hypothetical protein
MKYDIATKVLMDKSGQKLIERFLGFTVEEFELIEELPQESVSLKRSDYILKVRTRHEGVLILVWEFLSNWNTKALLNLIDYTVRAMLKFEHPVFPILFLLQPDKRVCCPYEDKNITFRYRLIDAYELKAETFIKGDVYLLPFVPLMHGGQKESIILEAEQNIYTSSLSISDKADLLTALTIFTGLKSQEMARILMQRRRDIMIQSYAYELIKEEGRKEGILEGKQEGKHEGKQEGKQEGQVLSMQDAILDVLELRFKSVPSNIVRVVMQQNDLKFLHELHKRAVTANTLKEFEDTVSHDFFQTD